MDKTKCAGAAHTRGRRPSLFADETAADLYAACHEASDPDSGDGEGE